MFVADWHNAGQSGRSTRLRNNAESD